MDAISKIKKLNEQIKLRLSVPINMRTEKQANKLDNLCNEHKMLIDTYISNIMNNIESKPLVINKN